MTSPLTERYATALLPALRAASVRYEVLNVSGASRQFGLSMDQARELSRAWGCVVSFDYARWNTWSPEIRLPHGVRTNPAWSHRRDLVLDRRGRPRYRLIGLPSKSSVDQMATVAPELAPAGLFVVGDLLADAFLAGLVTPDPRLLGVFSGWSEDSLVPSLGLSCASAIRGVMDAQGAVSAVMTIHPRVRLAPGWPEIRRTLIAVDGLELLEGGEWETAFASCGSFFGDQHTSMLDVLSMTNRPITIASCGSNSIASLGTTPCDWKVGSAPQVSAQAIRTVMES